MRKATLTLRKGLNLLGLRSQKVFAVGFNKCGTTSLHALFESLGLPSYHGTEWRSCDDLRLLRAFDCFSDGIPKDLSKLDRLFPGSSFILQVRELEGWVCSRLAHIERQKARGTYRPGPCWDDTESMVEKWIRQRNAHHLAVMSYFAERPGDLLIVNFIRDDDAATRVCRFLGYSGRFDRPKKNTNPNKRPPERHSGMLLRSADTLGIPAAELGYDIYCPSLENSAAGARFPADTGALAMPS